MLAPVPFVRIHCISTGLIALFASSLNAADKSLSNKSIPNRVESRGEPSALGVHERRVDELRQLRDERAETLRSTIESQKESESQMARKSDRLESLKKRQRLIETWKDATFILASDRTAIGVRASGTTDIKLHALATVHDSETVTQIATRFRIPLVKQNDPEFETLASSTTIGGAFPETAKAVLNQYWKVRKYVPFGNDEDIPMVVFKDQETNQHRIGYMVKTERDALLFHPVGSRSERIRREQIESGTARTGTWSQLLIEPEADYLDIAALEIARHLGSKTNVPSFHAIALNVDVDDLQESVQLSKQLDETKNDRLLDLMSRLSGEAYVPDQRKEGTRILRRYQLSLHDQLSSRLVKTGVPMVAREELSKVKDELELSEGKYFDKKRHTPLTSSSHLITAKVGTSENGGTFRVSIRLTDIQTGKILFESNADIGRPSSECPSNYYVHGGELGMLVDNWYTKQSERGQSPKPLKPGDISSEPMQSRLGIFASHTSGEIEFQDLFSNKLQWLETDRFSKRVVQSPKSLPASEKLRWLTWEMVRSSLPTAGKITKVSSDRLELNIGSNQDVRTGTVFRVIRLKDSGYGQTQMVLPFELRADTVTPTMSTAFLQRDGLAQLWDDAVVEAGDIVLRRGAPNSQIRITTPRFDTNMMSNENRIKLTRVVRNGNGLQSKRLMSAADELANKLMIKMAQGIQMQGVTAISTDPKNPTHEIAGVIYPNEGDPNCENFSVMFSVKSVQDGRILKTVPVISVTLKEINAWEP